MNKDIKINPFCSAMAGIKALHFIDIKSVSSILPSGEGCVLTLDMMDDTEIIANIHASKGMQGKLVGYVMMHNGSILAADTMTAQPWMERRFERLSLPGGVSQFTLFDSKGQILAERLFFIMPFATPADSIVVSTNMRSLSPCCKISLDIQSQPNSSISFSAMDAATMTNGKEGNMKTWMLLSSEVSGYIDSPDYYFEADDAEHRRAADLLMMIQGWRRYDWQLMSGQKTMTKVEPNEDGLYLFGILRSRSKKRDTGNVDLSMTLFNRDGQSMSGKAKTDSLGRYSFKIPDCSGDWAVQIKSEKEGEAQNYIIEVDRHFSPAMRLLSPYETEMMPVGECNFFKETADEPEEEEFVSITKKVHVLPTVKIKSRRILGDLHVNWYDEDWAQSKASVYYDCDTYADELADKGEEIPTFDEWLKSKNSFFTGDDELPVEGPGQGAPDTDHAPADVLQLQGVFKAALVVGVHNRGDALADERTGHGVDLHLGGVRHLLYANYYVHILFFGE